MKSWNCAREFELDVGADRDSTGNRATNNRTHPRSGISLWHRLLTPISLPAFEVRDSEIRVGHRFPLWFEGRFITTCPKPCKGPLLTQNNTLLLRRALEEALDPVRFACLQSILQP